MAQPIAQPKDKLLILDLDETLIYATEQPLDYPPDFQVGPFLVYKRPFVSDFLTVCQDWFEVAVWTSASPSYAAGIVDALFPYAPSFVWASDRCTQAYDPECGEHYSVKNLRKVKQRGYRLEQIIVVDDTAEKHQQNYGNLVRVSKWTGNLEDTELLLLLSYLEKLRTAENIRTVEKRQWRSGVSIYPVERASGTTV